MRKINLINMDFGQINLSINNKSCSSFINFVPIFNVFAYDIENKKTQ